MTVSLMRSSSVQTPLSSATVADKMSNRQWRVLEIRWQTVPHWWASSQDQGS